MSGPSPERAPHALGASRDRVIGLDACRVLAALGVVWMHLATAIAPGLVSGRFGVPYFVAVATLLAMHGVEGRSFADLPALIRARAVRILRPFVVWSVIVGAFRFAKWRFAHGTPVHIAWFELLLEGTAGAYWFLPFIFVVGIGALALGLFITPRPRLRVPVALVFIAVAVVTTRYYAAPFVPWLDATWSRSALDAPDFSVITRYWFEVPMVCAAYAVALLFGDMNRVLRIKSWWIVGALAVVFAILVTLTLGPRRDPPGDHALGLVLLAMAFSLPEHPVVERIARIGRHGYFVYLSHVLLIWPFIVYAQRAMHHPGVGYLALATLSVTTLGVASSILARRVRLLRFLVP